ENEIAQSECAFNKKFVNYWLHCGFLTIKGEKMAKSLGNFIIIDDLLEKYSSNSVRLFFAKTHYRSQIDFSYELLDETENAIKSIKELIINTEAAIKEGNLTFSKDKIAEKILEEFEQAMANDINTPIAVSKLFDLVKHINKQLLENKIKDSNLMYSLYVLKKMLWVLGIDYLPFYEKKKSLISREEELLNLIIYLREELRKRKIFDLSDEIREKFKAIGLEIADTKDGPKIKII
ncbi:MAG: DALR domain-containing protein, partial [Candidatus Anstonellales archaeon]